MCSRTSTSVCAVGPLLVCVQNDLHYSNLPTEKKKTFANVCTCALLCLMIHAPNVEVKTTNCGKKVT